MKPRHIKSFAWSYLKKMIQIRYAIVDQDGFVLFTCLDKKSADEAVNDMNKTMTKDTGKISSRRVIVIMP